MKWGLIAYGRIARKFVASLKQVKSATLLGAASQSKIEDIRHELPDIVAYNSYDELFSNPDIDIVYISTTHNYHKENVLKALHAGKHVLCEKPMGIHADEVNEMISLANEKKLFLMEAVWTRFLPAYEQMKQHIQSGNLGEIKLVKGDFSFNGTSFDKNSRVKNPKFAAGAIWDVGLYPISLAVDIFDQAPDSIICNGMTDEQGVDLRSAIILNFNNDQQAILHCGIDLETIHDGKIFGTKQWIHLPNFWNGEDLRIGTWQSNQLYHYPRDLKTSFSYEINACYEAITNGWIEHPKMSHRHSRIIAEIMDEALRQLRIEN